MDANANKEITMKKEFVRNPYNYDSDQHSTDTGLMCLDESLTEQEFLEESDINYIAEKFMKTGMAPQVLHMPTYGDFEGVFDYQSAMNIIAQATQEFMSLPAKIRTRFDNDPQKLIEFIEDPNNRDEAIALGMIKKPDTMDTQSNQTETNDGKSRNSSTPQGKPQDTAGPRGTQGTTDKNQGTEKP